MSHEGQIWLLNRQFSLKMFLKDDGWAYFRTGLGPKRPKNGHFGSFSGAQIWAISPLFFSLNLPMVCPQIARFICPILNSFSRMKKRRSYKSVRWAEWCTWSTEVQKLQIVVVQLYRTNSLSTNIKHSTCMRLTWILHEGQIFKWQQLEQAERGRRPKWSLQIFILIGSQNWPFYRFWTYRPWQPWQAHMKWPP